MKLQSQTFTSNFVLNTLLGEITNIDSLYQSYRPTIQMAIQLLQTKPVLNKLSHADSPWPKRSLLTLIQRCTTMVNRDSHNEGCARNKQWIYQLIQEQTKQQETLVHVISILIITKCATQVNRQKLNEVMDALQKTNEAVNTLLNNTDILTVSQIPTDIHLFPYYTSLPQILPHVHETSCHTHNGLHWCSYDQHIVTKHTSSRRTQKYAQTHQISTNFNNAQIHRSHIWWNISSHDYQATVLDISSCKWTILQNRFTIPTSTNPPSCIATLYARTTKK